MSWLAESGAFLVAACWLFLPGAAFGFAAGMRGLALWAFAPVASSAVLATTAIIFGFAGISWSPWTSAAAALVAALMAWGLRVLINPSREPGEIGEGARWLVPVGIAIGALLAAARLALYVGAPDNPSQTNDGVFHLNALRYILESGSASSFDITGMLGISSFYPAAWHAPASLVAMTTGADIVVVANVTSIVVGALVWTSGIAWLTSVLTGGDRLAAGGAGALSAAIAAFPLLMVQWGVLYPSLLAIAVLPGAVALVVGMPRAVRDADRPVRTALWRSSLILVALCAVALAQPSLLLIWGVLVGAFGVWFVVGAWSAAGTRRRVLMVALVSAGVIAVATAWAVFGRLATGVWGHSRGRLQAIVDLIGNGLVGFPPAWAVSILAVVGLAVTVRRPALRWFATAWVLLAALYFVAVAVGNPLLRTLVAPFYADPYRLAAMMPVVVIPLAGIGLSAIVHWARVRLRSSTTPRSRGVGDAWALGVLGVLGVTTLVVAPVIEWRDVWTDVADRVTWYDIGDSTYLSVDERALLSRLPETVPDELIIGNPSTGMALGYALAGQPMYPLTWQPPQTQAYATLAGSLRDAATDPLVCPALDAIGARYVVDFGPGDNDYGHYVLPGFTGLDGRDGFELVDSEGDASLWRITACD